jgi:signal transduction histidine kinase
VYDLRSFSLDDMYRCSAELRGVGGIAADIDDAAERIVSYSYDELSMASSRERQCCLDRRFRTMPLSAVSRKELSPELLGLIVGRALEMAGPLLEQRKQRLRIDVPREGLLVRPDLGRLAQVVSNLVNNASKYSPVGSEVAILAARSGALARLGLRDEGIAIPREMLDSIFDCSCSTVAPA